MRIYEYTDPKWGHAFKRISKALHDNTPNWVEWSNYQNAETCIIHVVGGGELRILDQALADKKKVIIVQHTYFTSGYTEWDSYWKKANLTISFHNLKDYTKKRFNFLATPWGYDKNIFYRKDIAKTYPVFTTGHVAETEHLDDIFAACKKLGIYMLHTGEDFKWGNVYKHLPYMNDAQFTDILNASFYTTCLRDIEGFEMMGVEGLACGAFPIVLDLPTYSWYKGYGIFIDPKQNIKDQLVDIFTNMPTVEFSQETFEKTFEWKNICNNIYEGIRNGTC